VWLVLRWLLRCTRPRAFVLDNVVLQDRHRLEQEATLRE